MLRSIEKLFSEFDACGVSYCHWKSNIALNEALRGETDLDVLFKVSQRNEIEKCLANSDMKLFLNPNGQKYNGIIDYLGFDYDTAQIWHLHLHYQMTIGEEYVKNVTLDWSDRIVDRRVFDETNRFWVSRPEDELLLLFTRMALKIRPFGRQRKLPKHDLKEIDYLLSVTTKESFLESVNLFLGTDAVSTYSRIYNGLTRKKELVPLRKFLLRNKLKPFMRYNSTISTILSIWRECKLYVHALKNKLFDSKYSPKKRINPSGGVFIAIVGGDGSGKSTTVDYITKEFRKKIDVFCVYLGSGKGSSTSYRKIIESVGRRLYRNYKKHGGIVDKDVHKTEKDYYQLTIKEKMVLVAKALWVNELAKEKKHKLKMVAKARNAGMLVIGDRYPQIDTPGICDGPMLSKYINEQNYVGRKARKEFSVYSSAYTNPPNIIIRLSVPTEVALARRPEMSELLMKQKQDAIKSIRIPSKYYDIDTSKSFEESISEVMSAIWENI